MARLSLTTRAARLQREVRGRDLSNPESLPKYVRTDVDRFARAIGVAPERFYGYSPATRRRYISAAKQGRTARQERARVTAQRQQRRQRPPATIIATDDWRMGRIWEERNELLRLGVDTKAGPATEVDRLAVDVLLSDEGILAHIETYGKDYVLTHLKNQHKAVMDVGFARSQWRAFKASAMYPEDDDDERWFWYHAVALHYDMGVPA